MKYQDLKIRDATRIGVMGAVFSLAAVGGLVWPGPARQLIEPLLSFFGRGGDYGIWLAVFWIMSLLCWVIVAQYLISSPADNARTVARRVARNQPLPEKFDPSLLDPDDPDFSTPTWRYALARWRRARGG